MKIKKGDNVQVMAGKDRGKTAKVVRVLPERGQVILEGVNLVKKHIKRGGSIRSREHGGIIERAMPIDASNVMLVDPKENKPTRIRYEEQNGKKVRVAVKSGQVV